MAFGQPTRGTCSRCGANTWLQNKSKKLCRYCAHKTNQEAKLKRKESRQGPAPRASSESAFFFSLYEGRRDHWKSEVSGLPLPPKPTEKSSQYSKGRFFACFAHILRKGKYPELKLRVDNIAFLTPEEHTQFDDRPWELVDPQTGELRDRRWAGVFERKAQLLQEVRNGPYGR